MSFFDRFLPDTWAYVHNIPVKFSSGNIYVHFYESKRGKRKITLTTDSIWNAQKDLQDALHRTPIYHSRIVRWLNGRHDPEISRFDEVGKDDVVNMLKGRIAGES